MNTIKILQFMQKQNSVSKTQRVKGTLKQYINFINVSLYMQGQEAAQIFEPIYGVLISYGIYNSKYFWAQNFSTFSLQKQRKLRDFPLFCRLHNNKYTCSKPTNIHKDSQPGGVLFYRRRNKYSKIIFLLPPYSFYVVMYNRTRN